MTQLQQQPVAGLVDLTELSRRAERLRRDFDSGFAEPRQSRQAERVDLLAIRLGGDPYALPLAQVTELFADKPLTRLPCALPEFLGVAGFRGSVVPVYDLRPLLGYAGGAPPRWLVAVAGRAFALAFDSLDGTLRLSPDRIAPRTAGTGGRPHVSKVAQMAGAEGLRPLIDLDAVARTVRQLAGAAAQPALMQRQE